MRYVATYSTELAGKIHIKEYDVESLDELFIKVKMEAQQMYNVLSVVNVSLQNASDSAVTLVVQEENKEEKKSKKKSKK